MRDLTFVETGYLCLLLLISLVLPFVSTRLSQVSEQRRKKIVLTGQLVLGLAGSVILFSWKFAPHAFEFGVLNCIVCMILLYRENLAAARAIHRTFLR
jgi:hypothetical protein